MKVTVYRADDFNNNMGELIGFFSSKEEAESELEFTSPADKPLEGDFSEITEFELPEGKLQGISLSDIEKMASEEIWGEGEIIEKYYYF